MTADDQLSLLLEALEIMRHYRTRLHRPVDTTDSDGVAWYAISSWVNADAVTAADDIIRRARAAGLIAKEDKYG